MDGCGLAQRCVTEPVTTPITFEGYPMASFNYGQSAELFPAPIRN